jgi:hypothetical protein
MANGVSGSFGKFVGRGSVVVMVALEGRRSGRWGGLYSGVWGFGLRVQKRLLVAFHCLSWVQNLPANVFWTLGVDTISLLHKRMTLRSSSPPNVLTVQALQGTETYR